MDDKKFKKKFIAYIDILGFKKIVENAEAELGMSLPEILHILEECSKSEVRRNCETYGPSICPTSKYISRNLDFRSTQISDCIILSSELSPSGIINLIFHSWNIVFKLLNKGIACRGYITAGPVYHVDKQVIGSGYQKAYSKESNVTAFKSRADEKGTPFVEVDDDICTYIENSGDPCVKKMFERFVKTDGKVTALFPFKALEHSFMIGGAWGQTFDPDKEKVSNDNLKIMISNLKERIRKSVDPSNLDAIKKTEYYIKALDAQIKICNETDKIIESLRNK